MADKTIGELPRVSALSDDSLIPTQQQGEAMSVSGEQFKQFAINSVSTYTQEAKGYAESAQGSAQQAAQSASDIDTALASTETARDAALAAQSAAESAQRSSESASNLSVQEANNARQYSEAASRSEQNAKASETAAKKSENNSTSSATQAGNAKNAALAAQSAAESAKNSAENSFKSAQQSATQAATSAQTAMQYSGKPAKAQNGTWWIWNASTQKYEDSGQRAVLNFDKTYSSYSQMQGDLAQPENTIAIISSNVADENNAKIYVFNGQQWQYLADLSGFTGVGISSWEKTSGNGSPGTTDTYTLTLTDGRVFTYQVYNGKDGTGSGDMHSSVYDKKSKNTDIFDYVDNAVANAAIEIDNTPTASSANPVKSSGIVQFVADEIDKITPASIGARPDTWTPSSDDVGAIAKPQTASNGQLLGYNGTSWNAVNPPDTGVTSFKGRSGAVQPATGDYTASQVGAIAKPQTATSGQLLGYNGTTWAAVNPPATGVTTFNGRSGAVTPQSGDYTASQVGAIASSAKGQANGVASLGADGKVPSGQLPEISSVKSYTATLTTAGWTAGTDDRFYQTISIEGVTVNTAQIIVDVDLSTTDADARIAYLEAWANPSANEVKQGAGTLTFYAYEAPTVNIPINVGVA